MGITDRHKKPGGFRKLVNSLEVTPPQRRLKILEALKEEDADFVKDVQACLFEFDDFKNVNDMLMAEILFHMKEYKSLAVALHKTPAELSEKFKKNMVPSQMVRFREEAEAITALTVAEQMAARFRVVELARGLEKDGKIKIKSYNEKYPEE
jgi:flagellar motor switch protein FliG